MPRVYADSPLRQESRGGWNIWKGQVNGTPAWRDGDETGPKTLRISPLGLKAFELQGYPTAPCSK